MQLAFTLTMPGAASWNGKWSGDGKLFCIVKTFRSEADIQRATEILANPYYSYGWSDGWRAAIQVRQVDSSEAAKLRKASCGFHGYEWMVATIIRYGKPMADHEVADFLAEQKEPAASVMS